MFLEENIELALMFQNLTLEEFKASPIHVLAAEGLSVRIGENVKNLARLAPEHFGTERWSLAAKNRDKVAHDYQNLTVETLLDTVQQSFPSLLPMLVQAKTKLGITY
jgi:uncharacterized protein with HEPN domain